MPFSSSLFFTLFYSLSLLLFSVSLVSFSVSFCVLSFCAFAFRFTSLVRIFLERLGFERPLEDGFWVVWRAPFGDVGGKAAKRIHFRMFSSYKILFQHIHARLVHALLLTWLEMFCSA